MPEFSDIKKDDFRQGTKLKEMNGPPVRIFMKQDARPFAVQTPRVILIAWRDDVKKELDSMVARGIITPAGDEPSQWCRSLVAVA